MSDNNDLWPGEEEATLVLPAQLNLLNMPPFIPVTPEMRESAINAERPDNIVSAFKQVMGGLGKLLVGIGVVMLLVTVVGSLIAMGPIGWIILWFLFAAYNS